MPIPHRLLLILFSLTLASLAACGTPAKDGCSNTTEWGALIQAHHARYPAMELVDAFKLLQQAALGSEHAITDSAGPIQWMEREWPTIGDGPTEPLVDTLGTGGFARVNLRAWRETGRAPGEVVTAFVATARAATPDTAALSCAVAELVRQARASRLPWAPDSISAAADQWRAAGFPAVEHSAAYRAAYHPAYRVVALTLLPTLLTPPTPYSPALCSNCAEWNHPTAPFRLFGNTWFVGTRGLSALLLTSPEGHVLIDAGLPESAPLILENVKALGFQVTDIKLILNSHPHSDHAGGIAAVQRQSGAQVAASVASARVLRRGLPERTDPQFGTALPYPPVPDVREFRDGDTLRVGSNWLVAHATPGHTPGGTSWSWRVCQAGECLDFVYADSETPVSADDFHFTRNEHYPGVLADFERGFRVLEELRCDVLITPHPGASRFWERVQRVEAGDSRGLVDSGACRAYAATARAALKQRVAREMAP